MKFEYVFAVIVLILAGWIGITRPMFKFSPEIYHCEHCIDSRQNVDMDVVLRGHRLIVNGHDWGGLRKDDASKIGGFECKKYVSKSGPLLITKDPIESDVNGTKYYRYLIRISDHTYIAQRRR